MPMSKSTLTAVMLLLLLLAVQLHKASCGSQGATATFDDDDEEDEAEPEPVRRAPPPRAPSDGKGSRSAVPPPDDVASLPRLLVSFSHPPANHPQHVLLLFMQSQPC
eukprot:2853806-Rhodomonas_salina.2